MSTFKIKKNSIVWDDHHLVKRLIGRGNLLKSLFKGSKSYRVGLHLELNNKEVDTLWIDSSLSFTPYSDYVEDMYVVTGVTFEFEQDTIKYYEFLEKRLMWKILND